MKLLIATPLYPPDIAPLAVYVKELARRLGGHLDVTVIAYAQIPEKVPGVRIVPVVKNIPLPFRLAQFTKVLAREARKHDVLFVQNGASVELPASLVSFVCSTPMIVHLGDAVARASAEKRSVLKKIFNLVLSRATRVVYDEHIITPTLDDPKKVIIVPLPLQRPEILPFHEYPSDAMDAYEHSWDMHIQSLIEIFNHAKQ